MKYSKKLSALFMLLILMVTMIGLVVGCSEQPAAAGQPAEAEQPGKEQEKPRTIQHMNFGTYNPGGGYQVLGVAIASIINRELPYAEVTVIPSPRGGVDNIIMIEAKDNEFGLANTSQIAPALNGEEPFDKPQTELAGWFNAHYGVTYSVATVDSGIKSFKDFEGKRIAIGLPGSMDNILVRELWFPKHGVDISKVTIEELAMADAIELIKDGHLDGFIVQGAPGLAVLADLAATKDVRYVPLDEDVLDQVDKERADIVIREIQEGLVEKLIFDKPSYRIPTIPHVGVVGKFVDEEIVYEATKALFENIEEVYEVSATYKVITLEDAVPRLPEPHPGALRYYKEMGIVK